jgi:hypothetical protein
MLSRRPPPFSPALARRSRRYTTTFIWGHRRHKEPRQTLRAPPTFRGTRRASTCARGGGATRRAAPPPDWNPR